MHKAMEDLPERDAGRRPAFNYRFDDNGGSLTEGTKMRQGTKKLFPKDYERFIIAMISAEKDNELPVVLRTDDIQDCSLEDLRDLFLDFSLETGLEMSASLALNHFGKLQLLLEVDQKETEKVRYLQ